MKKKNLIVLLAAFSLLLGACGGQETPIPEPVNPEPTEPTEPTNPTDPTDPVDPVTPTDPVLVAISVSGTYKTEYTVGDTFDSTGIVVTATYDKGDPKVVTSDATFTGFNSQAAGPCVVTVTYGGMSTTINLTIAEPVPVYYTVSFVVNGETVQTGQVLSGEFAQYTGETPTKTPEGEVLAYRFKGWDHDISAPITADTVFTAQFASYVSEILVDDFENYEVNADMIDEGWTALTYTSSGWTDQTKATVSLTSKAASGQRALRGDAWENGVGYKFAKIFRKTGYEHAANAFKFKMMVPSINQVKIILHTPVVSNGEAIAASFTYTIEKPISSEYVEYTIPIADPGWALWGNAQSIAEIAGWLGIHQDDVTNYLTRIEFYVAGDDGIGGQPYAAFIDDVKFVTLDNPQNVTKEMSFNRFKKFTGKTASNNTVLLTINDDNSANARVLDLETPIDIPGTVEINEVNRSVTFTSADSGATLVYTGKYINSGQSINFVSSAGTMKDDVEEMKLNAVQVLDDFESYENSGTAYYTGNTNKENRSGARGAYYAEYYAGGSNSSEWGGNGWSIMGGSGDQTGLKQDASFSHSGNNSFWLKSSSDNAMRYMQWGLFDGTSVMNAYRGTTLSFWAKTKGFIPAFKVVAYSQTNPKNATKDNSQRNKIVCSPDYTTISEWTHYEVKLNPSLVYYGFLVFMEKNYNADTYLYIDDVEIYTDSPYAEYKAPVVEVPSLTPGTSYIGKYDGVLKNQLDVLSENEIKFSVPGFETEESATYSISQPEDADAEITMEIGTATYVGTLSEDFKHITFKSISGTGGYVISLDGMNFDMASIADNAETYNADGIMYYQSNNQEDNCYGARGAYYCDYYNGDDNSSSPVGGKKWTLMGGFGNQLQLDKTTGADGNQSLKMKKSTAGNMRYLQWELYKGTGEARTGYDRFFISFKNTNATETKVKVLVYKVQKVTKDTQGDGYRSEAEITVPANTDWTRYEVQLDPNETYYGYGIITVNDGNNTNYIHVDAAYYSNVDTDPTFDFYTFKNLTLSGTTLAGPATLKFDEGGDFYATCAGLNIENVKGSYSMVKQGSKQVMTLSIGGSTIKGTYAVDDMGVVSLTVTEVTGDLSAAIAVDTVFSFDLAN